MYGEAIRWTFPARLRIFCVASLPTKAGAQWIIIIIIIIISSDHQPDSKSLHDNSPQECQGTRQTCHVESWMASITCESLHEALHALEKGYLQGLLDKCIP
jgi:hypothetical protein